MTAPDTQLRFKTFLAPEMFDVYRGIVDYLGRELGVEATISVGAHNYDVFEHGDADFGFI